MSKQPSKSLPEDPEQSQRFKDMARELGADESPTALDDALKRVSVPKPADKPKA